MGFVWMSGVGGGHLLVDNKEPEGPENQIDVVAIDTEVALSIECKSSSTPRKAANFQRDLSKHAGMRERFIRAVRQQLPESKRTTVFILWTSSIAVTDNDRSG
jgi:hypothetical protein